MAGFIGGSAKKFKLMLMLAVIAIFIAGCGGNASNNGDAKDDAQEPAATEQLFAYVGADNKYFFIAWDCIYNAVIDTLKNEVNTSIIFDQIAQGYGLS